MNIELRLKLHERGNDNAVYILQYRPENCSHLFKWNNLKTWYLNFDESRNIWYLIRIDKKFYVNDDPKKLLKELKEKFKSYDDVMRYEKEQRNDLNKYIKTNNLSIYESYNDEKYPDIVIV